MMELFEALTTTRAVRRFTDDPVSDEEILTCLRAATQGPSGGNIQPWQFLVVTDPATKRALGDVYRRAYTRYEPAVAHRSRRSELHPHAAGLASSRRAPRRGAGAGARPDAEHLDDARGRART